MMNHSHTYLGANCRLFFGAVIGLLGWSVGMTAARAQQAAPRSRIDLDQAIELAVAHNHALKATQSQILQSQAQETTAAIRPNPVFLYDDLYVPVFSPNQLNGSTIDSLTEFDVGFSYTFERGHKRNARIQAARDQTTQTKSQVSDAERTLTANVAQQFIGVLLAKSNLKLAQDDLASYQQTVNLSQESFLAGAMSEGDLLRIKLQLLQFQMDLSSAKLALVQALASLRQLLGFESVPAGYDVTGELVYAPLGLNQEDLQLRALKLRPDLLAAQQGVTAAQSQYKLAKANGKRDLTTTLDYTHVSDTNSLGFSMSIEMPFFDRNQGEIARTHHVITQAQETSTEASETVMTDVANAYQGLQTNAQVVELYTSGYLKQAQDSRDISEYAYKRGAASLLDFLDAERSYRATQLAYRQALANYMTSLEVVRQAVGTRNLP
jgi:cobalt-zinc-cadmium efflux system outer membrane protein